MHLRTAVPTIAAIASILSGCSGGSGGSSQADVVETIGTNSPRMMASVAAGTSLLVAQLKCDELNSTQGTTPNSVANQADEANRVGDLDDLLATEAPTSGKWTFDFRAVTGSWTLRVDKNRDGVFETVRTGSHPAILPTNPRQMLGIEPAGGSGAGQVTLSDFTIGYTLIPASAAN